MAVDVHTAEITGLHLSVINTEGYIDKALDMGDRRAFRVWCKRRASLASRLQRTLVILATSGTGRV
jgi:hypothetical protein